KERAATWMQSRKNSFRLTESRSWEKSRKCTFARHLGRRDWPNHRASSGMAGMLLKKTKIHVDTARALTYFAGRLRAEKETNDHTLRLFGKRKGAGVGFCRLSASGYSRVGCPCSSVGRAHPW